MSLLDVGNRLPARLDATQEIDHVPSNRRRDVLLEVLLGLVFWIFFQLHDDVAMDALPLSQRDKVKTVDAQFERPLVAIDRRPPRILRISRVPPRTVFPDDRELVELERRRLSIRDIRLAVFVDQNPAG